MVVKRVGVLLARSPHRFYDARASSGAARHHSDNPMSSSPKRRVTFSTDITEILPPDESSILRENSVSQDEDLNDRPDRFVADKGNPYVMDFIIDNPTEDPEFDPASQWHTSSDDLCDENSTRIDVASTAEPLQTSVSRYNLRPRSSRIPTNISRMPVTTTQTNQLEDQCETSQQELLVEKSSGTDGDDLIPPDVTDLDEDTISDINAILADYLAAEACI